MLRKYIFQKRETAAFLLVLSSPSPPPPSPLHGCTMNHNWQRKWHNTKKRSASHSLSLPRHLLLIQFDKPSFPLCENKSFMYVVLSSLIKTLHKISGNLLIILASMDCAPCGRHELLTSGGRLSVLLSQLHLTRPSAAAARGGPIHIP